SRRCEVANQLPGTHLSKDAPDLRGGCLIRSIEIIVIATKSHLNFRYIVQFNMRVAKQEVHALELAVERVAAATAQREGIGVRLAGRAVGQNRQLAGIRICHARRPGDGIGEWIKSPGGGAADAGRPPSMIANGQLRAKRPGYGAG